MILFDDIPCVENEKVHILLYPTVDYDEGMLVALSFVGLLVLRFLAAAAAVPGRQVGGRGSSARRGSRGGRTEGVE